MSNFNMSITLYELQLKCLGSSDPCGDIIKMLSDEALMASLYDTYYYITNRETARVFLWAVMIDSNPTAKCALLALDAAQMPASMAELQTSARALVFSACNDGGALQYYDFMSRFQAWCDEHWTQRRMLLSYTHLYYDQRHRQFQCGKLKKLEERVLAVLGVRLQQKDASEWRSHEYLYASLIIKMDACKDKFFLNMKSVDLDQTKALLDQFTFPTDENEHVAAGRCVKQYCNFLVFQRLLPISAIRERLLSFKPSGSIPVFLDRLHRTTLKLLVEGRSDNVAPTWLFEMPFVHAMRDDLRKFESKAGTREGWAQRLKPLIDQLCRVHGFLWNDFLIQLILA